MMKAVTRDATEPLRWVDYMAYVPLSPTTEFVAWSGRKWPTPPRVSMLVDTHSARRLLIDEPRPEPANAAWTRLAHHSPHEALQSHVPAHVASRSRSGQEHDDDVGKVEESQVNCQAGRRLRDKTQEGCQAQRAAIHLS